MRRRPYDWDTGPLYLTTYLREEGRLAQVTGDSVLARRAWDRYLALRDGTDAGYRSRTETVRRAREQLR